MRWWWSEHGAGRIDVVIRGAGVLVVAGVLAGGGAYVVNEGGGAPDGTAHVWIDDDGGTCVDNASPIEYDDASACGSIDAANDIMDNGDAALMMGGSYSGQSITGGNGRSSMATVTMADDETATVSGSINFSTAEWVTVDGGGSRFGVDARLVTSTGAYSGGTPGGIAQTENQHSVNAGNAENVTIKGADFGGWNITDSRNVTYMWNDIGPCHTIDGSGTHSGFPECDNGSVEYCDNTIDCGSGVGEGYNTGHLIEGNWIHDFGADDSFYNGSGSDEPHWECMYISYVDDLTIRGNVFINCANGNNIFHTFSNGGGAFVADYGNRNMLIENNVFTQSCSNSSSPCGGRHDSAAGPGHCNIHEATPDFEDSIVRFNTFVANSVFALQCQSSFGATGADITASSEFRFYGNIMKWPGSGENCGNDWAANQGGANPEVDYNLFYGTAFTCGTNGENIGATLDIVVGNSNTAPDAHLTGSAGSTEADNFVPVSEGCPTHDIDGDLRATDGFCDAGADER